MVRNFHHKAGQNHIGMPAFSVTLVYGVLMFIFLAIFLCVLSDLFAINDRFDLAALCGFTVTYPVILMM